MALNTTQLESQLLALFNSMRSAEQDETYYAHEFSLILETYIKTGNVVTNVTVTGVQAGVNTAGGTGTGTIS